MARGLSLSNLSRDGFVAALKDLASVTSRDFRVPCEVECPDSVSVGDEATTTHLYRIAREAVHNATKHARPRRIVVRLSVGEEMGCLEVEDDGIGMEGANGTGFGLGLEMMRSRARMIGGQLEILRALSGGTTIACRFPMEDPKTDGHCRRS